jgi:hypothetical protein
VGRLAREVQNVDVANHPGGKVWDIELNLALSVDVWVSLSWEKIIGRVKEPVDDGVCKFIELRNHLTLKTGLDGFSKPVSKKLSLGLRLRNLLNRLKPPTARAVAVVINLRGRYVDLLAH